MEGLTKEEVNERINLGKTNNVDSTKTKTIKEIFISNICTYFNILNIFLGLAIIISSIFTGNFLKNVKNCLFVGVTICNTAISIYQEIKSKKIIDELSVLSKAKAKVIRDGKEENIEVEEIVLDDIIKYSIGDQIVTDSIILNGTLEVNESALTGESNNIVKKDGDTLLSGSFVVSGNSICKVIHVGNDNYINSLSMEAKTAKENKSVIFNSFEKLVKILSYILVPLGIMFFLSQYQVNGNKIADAIISTVAGLIGMIPEGLVLLTSSVMAVSVIKLSKSKVLVQKLYCIETLARVNCICLDKTGTITTGNMKLNRIIPRNNYSESDFEKIITKIINGQEDHSSTFNAIKDKYSEMVKVNVVDRLSFSSDRKFSGLTIDDTTYYLGAPEYVLKHEKEKIDDEIKNYQNEFRTLVVAKTNEGLSKDPSNLEIIGYILIEDEIRKEAKDTLTYFKEQGVEVKIISGDNPLTVLNIANKVGLENIKGIDATKIDESDIDNVVKEYTVFGRVTPHMKRELVRALKRNNYTVAMTGDGVNDILALKEADCSVAMASGTDATKSVSDLVLLDSNFASMPKIVLEGRQTINNIERSASLLLVKTIYTILLILTTIITGEEYFFKPINLTLITMTTIGIPSFILALEKNNNLIDRRNFLLKIFKNSLPGGLTVLFNVIILLFFKEFFTEFDDELLRVLAITLTGTTGFIHLYYVCKPFNYLKMTLYSVLLLIFILGSTKFNFFFDVPSVDSKTIVIGFLLIVFSMFSYQNLKNIIDYLYNLPDLIKKKLHKEN